MKNENPAVAERDGDKWWVKLYGRRIFSTPYEGVATCLAADISTVIKQEAEKGKTQEVRR